MLLFSGKEDFYLYGKGGFWVETNYKCINGFEQVWLFGCGDEGSFVNVSLSYKYLGLILPTRNSFSAATEDMAVRGKKSTIEIIATLRKIYCNLADVFLKLFDAQVVPTLLYGAEIWGYRGYDQIESVRLFAGKRFFASD